MDAIFNDINWVAVVVASVVAFALGSVWYGPMFGKGWRAGIGQQAVPGRPLGPLMVIQFVATVLFAWALAVAMPVSMWLAILIAVAAAALIKANGFFAGKSVFAIMVESSYVIAQAAIILVVLKLF